MTGVLEEPINNQLSHVQQLLHMTEQMREALLSRNMDHLDTLLQAESHLLEEIKETDDLIRNSTELHELMQSPLKEKVLEIKSILHRCQTLNAANQEYIDLSMGALNRFKKLLVSSRNQQSLTYTGKGQPHTMATSGQSIEV